MIVFRDHCASGCRYSSKVCKRDSTSDAILQTTWISKRKWTRFVIFRCQRIVTSLIISSLSFSDLFIVRQLDNYLRPASISFGIHTLSKDTSGPWYEFKFSSYCSPLQWRHDVHYTKYRLPVNCLVRRAKIIKLKVSTGFARDHIQRYCVDTSIRHFVRRVATSFWST